jgi:hypothetical protein
MSAISTSGGITDRLHSAHPARCSRLFKPMGGDIIAKPALGGLHHIYQLAA